MRALALLAAMVATAAPALAQDAPAAAPAGPPPGMPRFPTTVPAAWTAAEQRFLWPGAPPESGFRAQAAPPGTPPIFLRNIDLPYLRVFRPERANGTAVLVIPGGAYDFISIQNEGVDVAAALNARGLTVFVLIYRLPGEGWSHRADVPLQDAQRAMRLIRGDAARYQVDARRVAVLGFSAGGHLAATLATDFDQRSYAPRDAVDRLDARPDAAGLIYPVIAARPPLTHALSATRLLGDRPTPEDVARRSPADRVTTATPPVFLAHSLDDPAVPSDNALAMMQAMRAAKRPVEAHFFEEGGHGYGVGRPERPNGAWPVLFVEWLERTLATRPAAAPR
jgi:acetyl esterase/lipase